MPTQENANTHNKTLNHTKRKVQHKLAIKGEALFKNTEIKTTHTLKTHV